MAFFKKSEKKLARRDIAFLRSCYEKSEKNLLKVARTGDEKELAKAMAEHHKYEYALLYKKTPEYKNSFKNTFRR